MERARTAGRIICMLVVAGAAASVRATPVASCRQDAGVARAAALVAACKAASPATHPPCNDGNPCSTMLAELRRSCAPAGSCGEDGAALALRARDAVAAWQAAQNGGRADDYFALYDAATFVGVKRTTGGAVRRYDFAAWRQERARMLASRPLLLVDHVIVHDIDHPDGTPSLDDEHPIAVELVQRWRSPRYVDHGRKILRWCWRKGQLRIAYEEMLDSAPGWDDSPPWARLWLDDSAEAASAPLDGTTLRSPIAVRVVGEPLGDDDPPTGLVRIELRDAAGVEKTIGLGPLLHVDAGDYAVGGGSLLLDHTFWWAGGGVRVQLRRRSDLLVLSTSEVQEGSPGVGAPELAAKERLRIRLPPRAQLLAR